MNKEKQIEKAVILTYLNNENIMEKIVRQAIEDGCIHGQEGLKIIFINDIFKQIFKTRPFCSELVEEKDDENLDMEEIIRIKSQEIVIEMARNGEISAERKDDEFFSGIGAGPSIVKLSWTGNLI